jgi:XRE family transcriptional regulator, regulator of sulfur utilization
MNLGEKLKLLRRSVNNKTLLEVSKETKLSVSFLSDLERGQTRPSYDTLEKLAAFYKVNLNELLATVEKDKTATSETVLPTALQELLKDIKVEPDILDLMLTAEQRSKNKPMSKDDWKKYYYSLKMLLGR